MSSMAPVPIFWRKSSARSFAEVPLTVSSSGIRFKAIELQRIAIDDQEGHIVAIHRPDGEVELYAEASLALDESWFFCDPPFSHFKLAVFQPTEFDEVRCDVGGGDIDAVARFTDCLGERVEMRLRHRSRRRVKPMFTPAPPHDNPQNLRFLLVNDFRLLPSRGSLVSVSVDGRPAVPAPFLVPSRRLAPMLGARGATDLLMVGLLPAHESQPLAMAPQGQTVLDDQTVADVSGTGLRSIAIANDAGRFVARMFPALPDLEASASAPAEGRLEITSSLGQVATGGWRTTPTRHGAVLELIDVVQDWSPGLGQPARMLLQQARKRRRRSQRWHYRATIERASAETWISTGGWSN